VDEEHTPRLKQCAKQDDLTILKKRTEALQQVRRKKTNKELAALRRRLVAHIWILRELLYMHKRFRVTHTSFAFHHHQHLSLLSSPLSFFRCKALHTEATKAVSTNEATASSLQAHQEAHATLAKVNKKENRNRSVVAVIVGGGFNGWVGGIVLPLLLAAPVLSEKVERWCY
jgi:hypothetical protein